MNAGKAILLGLLFCIPLLDLTVASADDENGHRWQQAPKAPAAPPSSFTNPPAAPPSNPRTPPLTPPSGFRTPPPGPPSGNIGASPGLPSGGSSAMPQKPQVLPCGLVGQACCRTPMGAGAGSGQDAITCLVSSGGQSGCKGSAVGGGLECRSDSLLPSPLIRQSLHSHKTSLRSCID
ncbi:hypothetical protein KFL_000530320 [Klebsormidium nitens]|uniref:Uncharacterized protein n=1 Tax=Klebsormidium nitens TaxID=105231 RepID=A0A1Y1HP47_KLENI|nr:hypothetical protein KFL_000530320 [Klebsormidium nitens]|eukprot:GAQ80405.1 hypothetical protein KFL_000530320 [Klebsormidium nitens]